MYPDFNEAKVIAIDCIRFFCFSGAEQMASWRIARNEFKLPRALYDDSGQVTIGDYLNGIVGVLYTYMWVFHEMNISEKALEIFYDFKHRLDVMSCTEGEGWSSHAIIHDVSWGKLRADASVFLKELGEVNSKDPPVFDVGNLINIDEFRTSNEARKLLE